MLRVVFMGTPDFAVPILRSVHKNFQVVAVYTQKDRPVGRGLEMKAPPVKVEAQALGLPCFQPERISEPGELDRIKSLTPDVIVVVAYGHLLKKDLLESPRLGCVNIHASLLPRWRGAAPIQWSIIKGDAATGVTTMKMAEKLDAGDVLMQESIPIKPEETSTTLHEKLSQLGASIIGATLIGLDSKQLKGIPQDEKLVTFAPKLTKAMEWLNADETAEDLERRLRALNPWPGTSVWVRDGEEWKRLRIKKVRIRAEVPGMQGRIHMKSGMLLMGVHGGSLELLSLQWEGRNEMDPAAFLSGLRGRNQALPLVLSDYDPTK